MIKRLNQYLLTNYPVIWNLKLVPLSLLIVAALLCLFIIGYVTTNNTIDNGNSIFEISYYLIYAGSILAAILIFIFWLVQYNKYNGLKAHYPRSAKSLYVEWLLIFVLCSFICFLPNSLSHGKASKIKSAATEQECKEIISLLRKVNALNPTNTYTFSLGSKQKPLLVGDAEVDRTKFDRNLFNYEENALTPENPIEYVGPSYLYFKDNDYATYYKGNEEEEIVHRWLVNQEKDSIQATLQAFIDLQNKYKLKSNITLDYWMSLVYNPPLYPVDEDKLIMPNDYEIINHVTEKYTQYDKLSNYYLNIDSEYKDNFFQQWNWLISLIVGLGLSTMVFSARFTSGKSWIFAFLAVGVIGFAFSIIIGILAIIDYFSLFTPVIYPALWLMLFTVVTYMTILKVVNERHKGRSNIYINIGIWFIPAIVPIIYQIYAYIRYLMSYDYFTDRLENSDSWHTVFVISIIFSCIVMYPAIMLLRKWKALPED